MQADVIIIDITDGTSTGVLNWYRWLLARVGWIRTVRNVYNSKIVKWTEEYLSYIKDLLPIPLYI